jgi:hypothetical protein
MTAPREDPTIYQHCKESRNLSHVLSTEQAIDYRELAHNFEKAISSSDLEGISDAARRQRDAVFETWGDYTDPIEIRTPAN